MAEGRGAFLVVYRDGTPVGCGALRMLDPETGELKRMYVDPTQRGQGLGRRLVEALEAEARALGSRRLVLETGTRQLAALALYEATGFRPIPLYGEYCLSPDTSVCLGKQLADSQAPHLHCPHPILSARPGRGRTIRSTSRLASRVLVEC